MGFRAKLITSYAAISLVTLILALGLFAFIINQLQTDATNKSKQQLYDLTAQVSDSLVAQGNRLTLTDYQHNLQFLARAMRVRILLVDSQGKVRVDTQADNGATMLNQVVADYQPIPRDNKAYQKSVILNNVKYVYYARPGLPLILNNAPAQAQGERVSVAPAPLEQTVLDTEFWLAQPEADLSQGWNEALPLMAGAGLLVLVISIGLALIIARSIARPLIRMTIASASIAQGSYDEQLPVQGRDEMARLAQSFNSMSHEVSQSQQTMRDFVANVSHELKTPLTSIQGYSQAILDGVADDPDSLQHSANVIYEEAARMRRLVDELLDLSRVESGQVELHRNMLDLNPLLYRITNRLLPLAATRQLRIDPILTTNLTMLGDADRLEQIFTNVLDNAIKYSPEYNAIRVEGLIEPGELVSRGKIRERYNSVVIKIANLGDLIPPEVLPRLFERFYMLDRSRKRRGESSGLGLAIVRELVEAHGGTIVVTSQPTANPGEGYTVFTIKLPLITPAQTTVVPPVVN